MALGPDDTPIPRPPFERDPQLDNSWKIWLRVAAVAALAALLAAVVIAKVSGVCGVTNCFRIQALTVQRSGRQVTGSFKMVQSYFSGIESEGYGGGCLIFEDPNGGSCTKQSDCTVPNGYCADKRCWIKVRETDCWKSIAQKPAPVALKVDDSMPTPTVDLSTVPQELFYGAAGKTRVRVVACLNGKFDVQAVLDGKAKPPCGGSGEPYDEAFGPPLSITK